MIRDGIYWRKTLQGYKYWKSIKILPIKGTIIKIHICCLLFQSKQRQIQLFSLYSWALEHGKGLLYSLTLFVNIITRGESSTLSLHPGLKRFLFGPPTFCLSYYLNSIKKKYIFIFFL